MRGNSSRITPLADFQQPSWRHLHVDRDGRLHGQRHHDQGRVGLHEHGPGHAAARPVRDGADPAAGLVARRARATRGRRSIRWSRCARPAKRWPRSAFLVALAHIPLATTSAVLQALPLAVTMGAAIAFGEEVRWRRWAAIAVGFTGVLIIVRPGNDGFNAYALWALASVVLLHRARPRDQARCRNRSPRCSSRASRRRW